MGKTSTAAKRRYNDKTYKRWTVDLRIEDFEMIDALRGALSRSQFLLKAAEAYKEKYLDNRPKMVLFTKEFNEFYDKLHNGEIEEDKEIIKIVDKMIKDKDNLVLKFVNARGDMLTSDRELMAFGFTLKANGWI